MSKSNRRSSRVAAKEDETKYDFPDGATLGEYTISLTPGYRWVPMTPTDKIPENLVNLVRKGGKVVGGVFLDNTVHTLVSTEERNAEEADKKKKKKQKKSETVVASSPPPELQPPPAPETSKKRAHPVSPPSSNPPAKRNKTEPDVVSTSQNTGGHVVQPTGACGSHQCGLVAAEPPMQPIYAAPSHPTMYAHPAHYSPQLLGPRAVSRYYHPGDMRAQVPMMMSPRRSRPTFSPRPRVLVDREYVLDDEEDVVYYN